MIEQSQNRRESIGDLFDYLRLAESQRIIDRKNPKLFLSVLV